MRLEKEAMRDAIRVWMTDARYIILTNYRGMQVRQTDELRRRLAKVDAQFHVVPNRLCKRVMAELQAGAADEVFVGPTALVSGRGDAIAAAQLLQAFSEEHHLPSASVKLGRFEGRFFSPAEIAELVKLPAKPVLYSMLLSTMAAPMTQLVGALQQKVSSLVYVLKAFQDKKSSTQ